MTLPDDQVVQRVFAGEQAIAEEEFERTLAQLPRACRVALLRQVRERQTYLLDHGFDVTVVAVADSKRFVVTRCGIDLARWREALDASARPMDPHGLAREIQLSALDETG